MFVLQSLVFGLFVTIVAFYANFLIKNRRFNELAKRIPGRKGLPLIGLLHKFAFRSYEDYLQVLKEIPDENSLTKFFLGPFLAVMINSPENLQTVLNSPCSQKKPGIYFFNFYYYSDIINKYFLKMVAAFYNIWDATSGLVLAHSSLWKYHRKVLNGSFTLNVLQRLLPMFQEKSIKSIQLLNKHVNKGQFDVYENIAAFSLETLMKGNFEYDEDFQTDPHNSELLETVEKGREPMMKRTFQIWNNYEPIFKLSKKLYKEVTGVIRFVRKTGDLVVVENSKRISHLSEEEYEKEKSKKSLISMLTDPKNNFSAQEINDEICTFIIAVSDHFNFISTKNSN